MWKRTILEEFQRETYHYDTEALHQCFRQYRLRRVPGFVPVCLQNFLHGSQSKVPKAAKQII
jgi:hypothetical protein